MIGITALLDRWAWARVCRTEVFPSDGERLTDIRKATDLKKLTAMDGWPLLKGLVTHSMTRFAAVSGTNRATCEIEIGIIRGLALAVNLMRNVELSDLSAIAKAEQDKQDEKKAADKEGGVEDEN